MKKLPLILGLCTGLLSLSALADVTLTVPSNVKLLIVNGEKVSNSTWFTPKNNTVTLPDGQNQLLLRYKPVFTQGSDRVEVESEAIITTFTAQNDALTFELPKYRNETDAKNNIDNLVVKLNGKEPISIKQESLIKNGVQIGRNLGYELEKYNQKGGIAAISVAGAKVAATETTNTKSGDTTAMKTPEEMLHFWYNKADADTKARFKAFVNQ